MDLSGGNISEDSFITPVTTLAEPYAVDFQLFSDLFSLLVL